MQTSIVRSKSRATKLRLLIDGVVNDFEFGIMGYSLTVGKLFISFDKVKDKGNVFCLTSSTEEKLNASFFDLPSEVKKEIIEFCKLDG